MRVTRTQHVHAAVNIDEAPAGEAGAEIRQVLIVLIQGPGLKRLVIQFAAGRGFLEKPGLVQHLQAFEDRATRRQHRPRFGL